MNAGSALDLDARGAAAAQSLRDSVVEVRDRLPAPDDDRHHRRRPLVLAFAAVVLVALVAGGVALLSSRRNHAAAPLSTGGSTVPRLLPGQVPAGLDPTGAADWPGSPAGPIVDSVVLYGAGGGANPFAGGDLQVTTSTGEVGLPSAGEAIEVRGRPGRIGGGYPPGVRSLTWMPDDHTLVNLSSRSLADTDLEAAAPCFAPGVKMACTLAGGLEPVATLLQRERMGAANVLVPAGAEAHAAGYQDSGADNRVVVVASFAGGADDIVSALWELGPDAHPVTVRGHDGWLAPSTFAEGGGQFTTLVWRESPDVVVAMMGGGVTEDELLAAAETLRPATDAEWAALVGAAGHPGALPDGATLIGEGNDGGVAWRVYTDHDGGVCTDITVDGSSSSSCSGSSGGAELPTDAIESPALLYGSDTVRIYTGRIGAAVAGVAVSPDSTSSVLRGSPAGWYAVAVTGPRTTVTFAALDEAGATVGSVTIDETAPAPGAGSGPTTTAGG